MDFKKIIVVKEVTALIAFLTAMIFSTFIPLRFGPSWLNKNRSLERNEEKFQIYFRK